MVMKVLSYKHFYSSSTTLVLLGEGRAPEIPVAKSVRIIMELETIYCVGNLAQPAKLP